MLFLAHELAGLPFTPFDLFEWVTRTMPGGMVTAGIEGMVSVLGLLGLSLRNTAKLAEQIIAVVQFLGVGIVAGAVLYAVLQQVDLKAVQSWPGLVLGGLLGLGATVLGITASTAPAAGPTLSVIWVMALFLVWGALLNWSYAQLARAGGKAVEAAEAAPADALTQAQMERRAFLIKVGGATAAITVVGAGLGAVLSKSVSQPDIAQVPAQRGPLNDPAVLNPTPEPVTLPDRPGAVEPAPGTRFEYTPLQDHYRIDIDLIPPEIDGAGWSLPIYGLVDNPVMLTLEDFHNKLGDPVDQFVTLACISNPLGGDLIGTTRWTGIPAQRVLDMVKPQAKATHLEITGQDGFWESVAISDIMADERIMFAYLWDGVPLLTEHGYPLRIYIPDRYGMKQPKWITDIKVTDQYRQGYWVERGWDEIAKMKATSVIDTVAVNDVYEQNGQQLVPIGGIAHAGARGISKVEVQVDGGDWVRAELRTPLSQTTWVIWRYDWPFAAGEHTFAVRCYDGAGVMQDDRRSDPHPSGATGIYQKTETL